MLGKKKEKLPQYIPSALNTPMTNYRTYVMSAKEKIINGLLIFIIGGLVALVFYGGQFLDEDGLRTQATLISDIVIFVIFGLLVTKIYMPIRREKLREKRKTRLTQQFRSFLESMAVSLSSGMNVPESLNGAYNDLKIEYTDDADMIKEVEEMIKGIQNNIAIEVMIRDLGNRSEIDDIKNFAEVFAVSYRAGGNLKDVVRKSSTIISEKIEISAEIETALASNKMQFNAMMVIPVVLVLMLRFMSSDFAASFSTVTGIFVTTIALCIFFAAYKLGNKIMKVKG